MSNLSESYFFFKKSPIKNLLLTFSDIFGKLFDGKRARERKCHWYACAECTFDHHCNWNRYCSGYTCVSPVESCSSDFQCHSGKKCENGLCQYWIMECETPIT